MVKIVILGNGLIPRGGGIAPRLNPFEADINLIRTSILTNGLQVYMINPDTGNKVRVTMQNYEKMYKAFDHKPAINKVATKVETPKAPEVKPVIIEPKPVETPVMELKTENHIVEKENETMVDNKETSTEETPLVPVNNPNSNNDYKNNKHNNKK